MKSKKSLIALCLIVLVAVISLTYAYFSSRQNIENEFKTDAFSASVVQTIVSPDDWAPGKTIDKNVVASNNGDVDVAVRISYTEEWKSSENAILDNEVNGERLAIINFSNEDDWFKEGNYYYYNKKISKNEQSSSFISSITYNASAVNSTVCENSLDGKNTKCITKITGYEGATYTLNIKMELVQYSAYKQAWSTNVVIN